MMKKMTISAAAMLRNLDGWYYISASELQREEVVCCTRIAGRSRHS